MLFFPCKILRFLNQCISKPHWCSEHLVVVSVFYVKQNVKMTDKFYKSYLDKIKVWDSLCMVLRMEPTALRMLEKCPTTELHQLSIFDLWFHASNDLVLLSLPCCICIILTFLFFPFTENRFFSFLHSISWLQFPSLCS